MIKSLDLDADLLLHFLLFGSLFLGFFFGFGFGHVISIMEQRAGSKEHLILVLFFVLLFFVL
jgi:hypothetical protein